MLPPSLRLEVLEERVVPSTYTVINTNDSGSGSLRQAILDVDANPGANSITFSIGSGVQTIAPTSALPAVSTSVIIDATTQPGYGGTPLIVLNGVDAGTSAVGLTLAGGSITVKGLDINGFNGDGIDITSNSNVVQGNYIGTDSTGSTAVANGGSGVSIYNGASGNTIGGLTSTPGTGAGNLISGNGNPGNGDDYGVVISGTGTEGNVVEGNLIGTEGNGTIGLRNGSGGVEINGGATDNLIGGTASGAGNVINGGSQVDYYLTGFGVEISNGGTTGNLVEGNYINTSVTSGALGTYYGVVIDGADSNTIGGTTVGAGNIISDNVYTNLFITQGSDSNIVQGNTITNGGYAGGVIVSVGSDNNTIGGTAPGASNIIADNSGPGVKVGGEIPDTSTYGNTIRGNSIYGNGVLGISLGGSGFIPNDADGHTGPNLFQDYPDIAYATIDGNGNAIVQISDATAGNAIDFYIADNSGQGETYIGSVTASVGLDTVNLGLASTLGLSLGESIVATATDAGGNTSEFSPARLVEQEFVVTTTADNGDNSNPTGSLRQAILNADSNGGGAVVFNILTSDGGYQASPESFTIHPLSALPSLSSQVSIDGTSEASFLSQTYSKPIIVLSGIDAGTAVGLTLNGSHSTIDGLVIDNFDGDGIDVTGNNNVIQSDYIGTDVTGALAAANTGDGVLITGANNAIGVWAVDGNVIAGNGDNGVEINGAGAQSNTVAGNYIGINAAGNAAIANGLSGILVTNGAEDNTIGGTSSSQRNVISGNTLAGITFQSTDTSNNVVEGNWIGLDATGNVSIPNQGAGVEFLDGASDNTLGGTVAGAGNVISGNAVAGVLVGYYSTNTAAANIIIQGNLIGTDPTGTSSIGNTGPGILLEDGTTGDIIGGPTIGARNIISGNTGDGVEITGSGTTGNSVAGNYIGTDVTGANALGNGGDGVAIGNGAANNTIGGSLNVLVADFFGGDVVQFSGGGSGGNSALTGAPGGFDPEALAYGPDGNLSVFSRFNGSVQEFAPDGQFIRTFVTSSGGVPSAYYENSLAIAPNGNLFISDGGLGEVLEYSNTGAFLGVLVSSSPGFSPGGIAVGPNGDVYVINGSYEGNVLEYSATGTFPRSPVATHGLNASDTSPTEIAFGAQGQVDILDGNGKVYYYDSNFNLLHTSSGLPNATYASPWDLQIGTNGNVYVSTFGNTDDGVGSSGSPGYVSVFSPTGAYLGDLAPAGTLRAAGGLVVTGDGAGNVISGNIGYGIHADSATTTGNILENNYVGTKASGSGTVANGGGALEITNSAVVQASGSFTGNVSDAGTLDLDGNNVSIVGAFTGSGIVTNSAASGTATLSVNGTGTFGGVIQNGGSASVALTIAGGTVTLTGANTYSGTTTISGGTLQIGAGGTTGTLGSGSVKDNAALVFDLSSNATIGNAISGSGTLTQSGSGTTTLSGANTYSGGTVISGGVLSVSSDSNLGADPGSATANITINGGTLQATNSFTLNSNRSIVLGPTSGSGGGTIDVTAGNTLTFSGTLTNNGSGNGSLTVTDSGTFTIDYTANGAPGGAYSGGTTVDGGATLVLKDTSDTFGHNNGNSFLGGGALVVTNATVSVQTTNPFGTSNIAPITLNSGGVMTMTDNMAANLGSLTLNGGTLSSTANPSPDYGSWLLDQDVTVGSGTSTLSATAMNWSGSRTFTVSGTLNVTGTFTGARSVSANFSLVKAGSGTMTLSGSNAYTGTTTISAGTLQIGAGGTTGTLGSGAVTDNGSLVFNESVNVQVGNAISGTGSLTQSGTGTVVLTNSNSYGTTTINTGGLQIGVGGSTGSLGTGAVTDNGYVAFDLSGSTTVSNAISGSGSLAQLGPSGSTVVLTAANSYGGTQINSGTTLQIGTGGSTGSLGTGAVSDNGRVVHRPEQHGQRGQRHQRLGYGDPDQYGRRHHAERRHHREYPD